MKAKLEIELDEPTKEKLDYLNNGKQPTKKDIKEELTQMLFEVCEDWVIRGQVPDLEFEGGLKNGI